MVVVALWRFLLSLSFLSSLLLFLFFIIDFMMIVNDSDISKDRVNISLLCLNEQRGFTTTKTTMSDMNSFFRSVPTTYWY